MDEQNTILALGAAAAAVVVAVVVAGYDTAEAQVPSINEAVDTVRETVPDPGEITPETFEIGETPPEQHVAPEGTAEPSDGNPLTTDPRDPGGSQTNTPYEEQVQDDATDAFADEGIIDEPTTDSGLTGDPWSGDSSNVDDSEDWAEDVDQDLTDDYSGNRNEGESTEEYAERLGL